jgi:hypothetical protein
MRADYLHIFVEWMLNVGGGGGTFAVYTSQTQVATTKQKRDFHYNNLTENFNFVKLR